MSKAVASNLPSADALKEAFKNAPACMQATFTNGFSEANRNKGMFQTAIYLKKKFPEGWESEMDALEQLNAFVEERVENGKPIDLDLFGAKTVDIKRK
jgi:hypothetical protein